MNTLEPESICGDGCGCWGLYCEEREQRKVSKASRSRQIRQRLDDLRESCRSGCGCIGPMIGPCWAEKEIAALEKELAEEQTSNVDTYQENYTQLRKKETTMTKKKTTTNKTTCVNETQAGSLTIVRASSGEPVVRLKDLQDGELFRFPAGNENNTYMAMNERRSGQRKVSWLNGGKLYSESLEKVVIRVKGTLKVEDDVK